MESTQIYGDLNESSPHQKLLKLEQENKTLLDKVNVLESGISKLCKELTQMKEKESGLKRNISELFNTAKVENERKQRMITELQTKLDDLMLKRNYKQTNPQNFNVNKRNRESDVTEQNETKKIKHDDRPSNLVKEVSKDRNRHKEHGHSSRSSDRNYDSRRHRKHETRVVEKERSSRPSKEREYGYNTEVRVNTTAGESKNSSTRSVSLDRNGERKIANNYIAANIKIEIKNDIRSKERDIKSASRSKNKKNSGSESREKSESITNAIPENDKPLLSSEHVEMKKVTCNNDKCLEVGLNIKEESNANISNDECFKTESTPIYENCVKDEKVPFDLKKEIKTEVVENTATTRRRRCVIKVVN